MEIYTIGFTKKSAEEFFETLRQNSIEQLVDVRRHNTSQLAGFAKKRDLVYFLRELLGADYRHEEDLAPTQELLKAFRAKEYTWDEYQEIFLEQLSERRVEEEVAREMFSPKTVLLCSEPTADFCHRRLVVEYLDASWGSVRAVHL